MITVRGSPVLKVTDVSTGGTPSSLEEVELIDGKRLGN